MNTSKYNFLSFIILGLLIISSCTKDPVIPIEEEVITTLIFTLTPDSGGEDVVLTFQDLDGDGGNEPIIMGGSLTANTTYQSNIELLNESVVPTENIATEVIELALEHQLFFNTSINGISIDYTDFDTSGNPLGLKPRITTTDIGSGTLTVTLRHQPEKNASGVSEGDITNAGGETDIEVEFDIIVE